MNERYETNYVEIAINALKMNLKNYQFFTIPVETFKHQVPIGFDDNIVHSSCFNENFVLLHSSISYLLTSNSNPAVI